MRYVNKLICLFITISFSSIQALPLDTVKDSKQEIHISDTISDSPLALKTKDTKVKTHLTTDQIFVIGFGVIVVIGIIFAAGMYSVSQTFNHLK